MRDGGLAAHIECILIAAFLLGSAALFSMVNRLHDQRPATGGRAKDGSYVASQGRSPSWSCYPWRGHSKTSLVMQMPQRIRC